MGGYRTLPDRPSGTGAVVRLDGVLGNDALGQGNVLDGSLEVGSGGRNYGSRRMNAYSYQNLQRGTSWSRTTSRVVAAFAATSATGPWGDFSGETGGDSIYRFDRASGLSSLNFSSDRSLDPFNTARRGGLPVPTRLHHAFPR